MNKELLLKYNTHVPRYTSYPPANFFTDGYTSENYLVALDESNSWEPQTISLYFHIPFCKKLCFYCGCNACPMPANNIIANYVEALKAEIRLVSKYINKERTVNQVHFGGGTPNSIPVHYLVEIMELVKESFGFSASPEIAIECNPAYLDIHYVEELKKAGFNRFSLGIQDFNVEVLKGVNREDSFIPVRELINIIKEGNQTISVNLDFIYGLPFQSANSFLETIKQAIDIRPDRLVTFSYAHVPWVNKNQDILERRGLPSNEEKSRMFELGSKELIASGYKAIGFDHFVRREDELYKAYQTGSLHRNFQGYCTRNRTGQVYAFGVSGISQLHKVYAQNTKDVAEYISSINKGVLPIRKGYRLDYKEIIIREVITELMCNKQLNWKALAEHLKTSIASVKETVKYNEILLKQFEEDGILLLSEDKLTMTEEGMLFIRNVAASFDPLYKTTNQQFSKPV